MSKVIGILGIQGAYQKHQESITKLGFESLLVRNIADLNKIDSIIIPGGESTAMITLLKKHKIWDELKAFCKTHPAFGTCAGAILLAKKVTGLDQFGEDNSLALMDIEVSRNSYGRQIDSFSTHIDVKLPKGTENIPAIFIRAPQILAVHNKDIEILANFNGLGVLLRQNNYLACAFHPELSNSLSIHDYFCSF